MANRNLTLKNGLLVSQWGSDQAFYEWEEVPGVFPGLAMLNEAIGKHILECMPVFVKDKIIVISKFCKGQTFPSMVLLQLLPQTLHVILHLSFVTVVYSQKNTKCLIVLKKIQTKL